MTKQYLKKYNKYYNTEIFVKREEGRENETVVLAHPRDH